MSQEYIEVAYTGSIKRGYFKPWAALVTFTEVLGALLKRKRCYQARDCECLAIASGVIKKQPPMLSKDTLACYKLATVHYVSIRSHMKTNPCVNNLMVSPALALDVA